MSFHSARFLTSVTSTFLLPMLFSANLLAQQPKVLAPHKPVAPKVTNPLPLPPPVQGSMVGGPWMVDANFKSSIYLKNGVETSAVTVTPVLYLSNGVKYRLHDVRLEPSGTAIVDINTALQNLGIASYATLSGYVEIDYSWPWDPICATIRNLDTAHSLIYHYTLRSTKAVQLPDQAPPTPGKRTNVIEGMWWKQESNVTGFVSLANTAGEPIRANIDVSDDRGASFAHHGVTISPHGMKTLRMNELSSATTASGGIRITYVGNATDLIINGGLEDQNAGYSADLPFSPAQAAPKISRGTVAELGLMAGAADPMMQFPAGTIFTPYTVIRNVSSSPLTATPTLWWMAAGTAHTVQLPAIQLGALQSRSLDLPVMMAAAGLKNFNGSLNLVFDREGQTGAVLMAGGSVDQSNTYVFEVTPYGVKESASKSLSYWSTGNGDNTMVTVWNPADEAQDFIFKLTFTGGHYLYPIHAEPRTTRTFNISEIIENQVPDSEGNMIPGSVNEGAARLMGSHGDNEMILVSMDAGIYNVRKATCNTVCHGCDGATSWAVIDNPFATAVAGTKQQSLHAVWNTGSTYDESSFASWTTGNSGVATVESNVQGQTPGRVHGVAAGSTYVSASDVSLTGPDYTSNWCEQSDWSCPLNFGGQASAPATVPSVAFSGISSVAVGQTATTTATVTPSSNTFPILLSITSPAAIVSPTGTFTQSTAVIVKGMSVGTATLTATVSNSDGTKPTVGSTSFPVVPPPPVISNISPSQGLVGTGETVTITGSGFMAGATVYAGSNISVSNVSVSSSTQITATFTPTNSSSAGGDQGVTVSVGGSQPSNSKNFYVQIPTHFQFATVSGAPGGKGPIVPVTNGTVYNLKGGVYATNYCGVYENFAYEILDQQSNPLLNGTATGTEVFTNISVPPGPTPAVVAINFANQGWNDTQAWKGTYPTYCPTASNDHQSLDYSLTMTIGSNVYSLATVVHYTKGRFNGTLNVTAAITTP